MLRSLLLAAFLSGLVLSAPGSARAQNALDKIGDWFNSLGGKAGDQLEKSGAALDKVGRSLEQIGNSIAKLKLSEEIGPADEFFIGREAAARLIGKSRVYPTGSPVTRYSYQVASTMALGSHAPYLYRPITVIVLDRSDVNAFATPGGILILTRGMLRFLEDEDEFAFILGHEMAHVELDHGLSGSGGGQGLRMASTLAVSGLEILASASGQNQDALIRSVDESLDQLASSISNGYSARIEGEADLRGTEIMARVGYDPLAALDVIRRFRRKTGSYGGAGYPDERLADLRRAMQERKIRKRTRPAVRKRRFLDTLRLMAARSGTQERQVVTLSLPHAPFRPAPGETHSHAGHPHPHSH